MLFVLVRIVAYEKVGRGMAETSCLLESGVKRSDNVGRNCVRML